MYNHSTGTWRGQGAYDGTRGLDELPDTYAAQEQIARQCGWDAPEMDDYDVVYGPVK